MSKLKLKIIFLITLGIFSLVFPITIINFNLSLENRHMCSEINGDSNLDYKNLQYFEVSGKIHIDNNWSVAKAAGICTGNGTYSDPYVIKNFYIDANYLDNCIKIENSDAFFRIENCTLLNSKNEFLYEVGYASIYLLNCENGVLIDNMCINSYMGIYISRECSNISIINNDCSSNDDAGIFLNASSNHTLSDNECYGSRYGIRISGGHNKVINNVCVDNVYGIICSGDNNRIIDNNCSYNTIGIDLPDLNRNDNTVISQNYCSYARGTGIRINGEDNLIGNCEITNNICIWNNEAVELRDVNNSKILNNIVEDSLISGITLVNCNNITIVGNIVNIYGPYAIGLNEHSSMNNIYFNCFDSPLNAYDHGSNNHWDNGNRGNFWSNYTGLDEDGNGIGDVPYNISGSAGSQDRFPLMKCPFYSEPINPIPVDLILNILMIIGGVLVVVTMLLLDRRKRRRM